MIKIRALLLATTMIVVAFLFPGTAVAALPPALFVLAHQDDEVLATGVPIVEHLAAGQDVHVLFLTQGEASGVLASLNGTSTSPWWVVPHDPVAEGYTPLGPTDLVIARAEEAQTALAALASGLPGTLTIHQASLPDGGVTVTAAQAEILAVADVIAPGGPVRLKTHTHVVDGHPDHLVAGQAARALRAADPGRFSDLRHYVEPPYWSSPLLSQVTESWDTPSNAAVSARVVNGCRSYGAWAPGSGAYAIGYHSVYATHFAPLLASPKAMVHP